MPEVAFDVFGAAAPRHAAFDFEKVARDLVGNHIRQTPEIFVDFPLRPLNILGEEPIFPVVNRARAH